MEGSKTSKASVRDRLQELSNKKRLEQEAEEEKAKTRKVAIDFGDSDEDEEEPLDQAAQREEAPAPSGRNKEVDQEGERLEVTADDRAFIDDADVAPENQIDFGDDEDVDADEAQEVDDMDEIDALFSKRKRRDGVNEAENRAIVENMLAQMEIAVEEDMKAYEEGRPAVHKLQMLGKVKNALTTKRLQSELLDAGLLGVLKAWIEPMPDGTLPNTKIRSSVLQLLGALPIDCAFEDRKAQLKRSGLGRAVLFLAKVPDEIPSNRKMAQDLVEKWSRPILAHRSANKVDSVEETRMLAARRARLAAAAKKDDQDGEDDQQVVAAKPGEAGFRWHAAIPQAATLDYVKQPAAKVSVGDNRSSGSKDRSEHKLSKKLKTMSKGSQFGRAANVSVEGRNVTLQH